MGGGGEGREGHHLEWGCSRAGGSWKHGGVEGAVSHSLAALTTFVGKILETWCQRRRANNK